MSAQASYSAKAAQERRRSFLDPRTKLALVVTLALFVLGGLVGRALLKKHFEKAGIA